MEVPLLQPNKIVNGQFTRTELTQANQVVPRFHIESVEDPVASVREGRPIFRDEERVEIILPGNPHTRPVHRVNDEHRKLWPEQYEAFKRGQNVAVSGTPLEQWPILKRAQVLELKALGFETVEQLAEMGDLAMQRIGLGGRQIKVLAQSYLDDAARGAHEQQLAAMNDRFAAENAELRRKVEELGSLVNDLHGRLQHLHNAPNAIAAAVPGMADPIEQLKLVRPTEPPAPSSLDSLPQPRQGRRGQSAKADQ